MISLLSKILTIKLTRKEFLVYIGTIFISILGVPSILRLISQPSQKLKPSNRQKITNYGQGAYGI